MQHENNRASFPEWHRMGIFEQNKRRAIRHNCNSQFEWTYFNKNDVFECVMLNCHSSGGYFESSIRPIPGATIFLRLKNSDTVSMTCGNDGQLRSATLAKVKWCHRIMRCQEALYGVGVKYYEHY